MFRVESNLLFMMRIQCEYKSRSMILDHYFCLPKNNYVLSKSEKNGFFFSFLVNREECIREKHNER